MPLGLLVMVPEPVPSRRTSRRCDGMRANQALTVLSELSVKVQVWLPELGAGQSDPSSDSVHFENENPAAAVAVSVTSVPAAKVFEHVLLQSRPAGPLVTVPDPNTCTVSVNCVGEGCVHAR